jgi:hypothetical protein
MCTKRAASSSSAFANDWQWLLSFPVLAAILSLANRWFGEGAISLNTDTALGALEAAGAAFIIALAIKFFNRLFSSASNCYYEEKERADFSEKRLDELQNARAKLVLRLNDGDPYRKEGQPWLYWQLAIFNKGRITADRVIVKLISITPTPYSTAMLDYPLELQGPAEFGIGTHIISNGEIYFEILRASREREPVDGWRLCQFGHNQRSRHSCI